MKRIVIAAVLFATALPALALGPVPDARDYSPPAWSPYLAGALIGVLSWFTLTFSKQAIGASSAYSMAAGLISKALAPRSTKKLKYFQDNPPKPNWGLVFVGFTILGAFLAAWHGQELTLRWLPPFWEERFGKGSIGTRAVVAFIGGGLMAYGARMAGGCTSGHGISGTLQLSAASWIALICFFVAGAAVANLLYRI